MTKKLCIIGAGPAGMMAALSAAESGSCRITIFEKNGVAGKKLLLTNQGCYTNWEFDRHIFVENYNNRAEKFLKECFARFSNRDLMIYLIDKGLEVYIERERKWIYPKTKDPQTILDFFQGQLKQNNIDVNYNEPVVDLRKRGAGFTVVTAKNTYAFDAVLITTGGRSFPKTGSTGDGYAFAKNFGHRIIPTGPAFVPIVIEHENLPLLDHVPLTHISLSLSLNGRIVKTFSGRPYEKWCIFWGNTLRGPIANYISDDVVENLSKGRLKIIFNFMADFKEAQLRKMMKYDIGKWPNVQVGSWLKVYLPEEVSIFIMNNARIKNTPLNKIKPQEMEKIISSICRTGFNIKKTLTVENSVATAGGISLAEVFPRTMRSLLVKNLSFAGEILDVNGKCGGFNLNFALTSGWIAGASLAE